MNQNFKVVLFKLCLSIASSELLFNQSFSNTLELKLSNILPADYMLEENQNMYITLSSFDANQGSILEVCYDGALIENINNNQSNCLKDQAAILFKQNIQYVKIIQQTDIQVLQESNSLQFRQTGYILTVTSQLPGPFTVKVETIGDTVCYRPCQGGFSYCFNGNCICPYHFFGRDCSIFMENIKDKQQINFKGQYYIARDIDGFESIREIYFCQESVMDTYCVNDTHLDQLEYHEIKMTQINFIKLAQQQCFSKNFTYMLIRFREISYRGFFESNVFCQGFWEFLLDKLIIGVYFLILYIILPCITIYLAFITIRSLYKKGKQYFIKKRFNRQLHLFTYFNLIVKYPGLFSVKSCAICLNTFLDNHEVRLTRCTHLFHNSCIDQWLKFNENKNCPICRSDLFKWKQSCCQWEFKDSDQINRNLRLFGIGQNIVSDVQSEDQQLRVII